MKASQIKEKYLNRLDTLIAKGSEICERSVSKRGPWRGHTGIDGHHVYGPDEMHTVHPDFTKWKLSVVNLLEQILPKEHPHRKYIEFIQNMSSKLNLIQFVIQLLQSIREDFSEGFLNDLIHQIEMKISSDYMEQAESLVEEKTGSTLNHIPAAVLAGAVLEKRLKQLCLEQIPEIPLFTDGGKPKTMNPLIEDLKKAGSVSGTRAKELKAWADIRNNAAHGNFESIVRSEVERMITGIKAFLSETG